MTKKKREMPLKTTCEAAIFAWQPVYEDNRGCANCGAHTVIRRVKNNECENCILRAAANGPQLWPQTPGGAKNSGGTIYYPHHNGLPRLCQNGPHVLKRSTGTRRCLNCTPLGHDDARLAARKQGRKKFTAPCAACGTEQEHSVVHGKCLTCYRTDGVPRSRHEPSARAVARKQGAKSYMSYCARCHMDRRHSVKHGECQTCYTSAGEPRAGRRGRPAGARTAARRAGAAAYPDHCTVCGEEQEHSPRDGKCVACQKAKADTRRTPDQSTPADRAFMQTCPQLIIPRSQALALGLGVYQPDTRVGWRYTLSGRPVAWLTYTPGQ